MKSVTCEGGKCKGNFEDVPEENSWNLETITLVACSYTAEESSSTVMDVFTLPVCTNETAIICSGYKSQQTTLKRKITAFFSCTISQLYSWWMPKWFYHKQLNCSRRQSNKFTISVSCLDEWSVGCFWQNGRANKGNIGFMDLITPVFPVQSSHHGL